MTGLSDESPSTSLHDPNTYIIYIIAGLPACTDDLILTSAYCEPWKTGIFTHRLNLVISTTICFILCFAQYETYVVLCFYCRLSLILSFEERNLAFSFPSKERFSEFSFLWKESFCTDRRCIASAPMSVNKRRGPGWFTGMGALLWAMQAVMEWDCLDVFLESAEVDIQLVEGVACRRN